MSLCRKARNRILPLRLAVLASISLLAFLLPPHPVQAYNFQNCNTCHKAALTTESSRKHLHSPFKKKQCSMCHAVSAGMDTAARIGSRKIDWLAESYMKDADQGFLLPGDKVGDTLVVELLGTAGAFSIHEIAVPPSFKMKDAKDSGKPPVITDLRLLKVQRGVLLSATIGWHTDTLTYAKVRYGDKDLSQSAGPSGWLTRNHKVVLYGLHPDKTYRFTAISEDIFGHRQVSALKTFSTTAPAENTLQDNPPPQAKDGRQSGILNCSFQRFGTDYLVELKLKQPAAIHLGCRGGAPRYLPEDAAHEGLSCGEMSSTEACLKCHNAHLDLVKHPTTREELGLPREFPTLPDDKVACTSCHEPHGSDYAYYKRKPSGNKLCANCHLWGFMASSKNATGQGNPHALKVSELPKDN